MFSNVGDGRNRDFIEIFLLRRIRKSRVHNIVFVDLSNDLAARWRNQIPVQHVAQHSCGGVLGEGRGCAWRVAWVCLASGVWVCLASGTPGTLVVL